MSEFDSWHEEKQSAWLYRLLAEREPVPRLARLFTGLARAAESQAQQWESIAAERGITLPHTFRPALRARIVGALLNRLGPRPMLPVLAAMKIRGLSVYTHSQAPSSDGHPTPVSANYTEQQHRGVGRGGNLRAAIFGVNDGLVSNASLILGVAGAELSNHAIFVTGLAGLLAGAFSMAAGEYVSMRSQREMFEYQIRLEREELEQYPEEETMELALIYEARGVEQPEAERMANLIISDPARALDTLTREELGLNPDELGSPWGAALSSFSAFAVGALVPLLHFLLMKSGAPLTFAVGFAALALFGVGCAASLFTGRSALASGARMLVIGSLAGVTTFAIGYLFGVSVS